MGWRGPGRRQSFREQPVSLKCWGRAGRASWTLAARAPRWVGTPPLPFTVNVRQGLLGRMPEFAVELREIQLFRLQVPGGTTRGRARNGRWGEERSE